jgi:hypothetical protein
MNPEQSDRNCITGETKMNAKALEKILNDWSGNGTLASMARGIYKGTSCGACLGVRTTTKWIYGDYIPNDIDPNTVDGLSVGSIVEGVDECTATHVINLDDRDPGVISAEFDNAVQRVEDDADEIWMNTHGCETCARHWNEIGEGADDMGAEMEGCDGMTPVWQECPDCFGTGVVI